MKVFVVTIEVHDSMTKESFVKSYEHSFEVLEIREQGEWTHHGGTDKAHLAGRCDCEGISIETSNTSA